MTEPEDIATRPPRFSVAILAGGESSRMGGNKALELLGGRPVIEHLIDSLKPLSGDTFIVANDAAAYGRFGLPVRADHFGLRASLVGVYSAVASAAEDYCFVTACDMPFADPALVRYMAGLVDGYDAVVPTSHRGEEPLHAFYTRACLDPMRRFIDSGDLALRRVLGSLKVRDVTIEEMSSCCDPLTVFFNVNTPADLDEAARLLPEVKKQHEAWPVAPGPSKPPLVCFVGKKDSGKTTVIEKLVALLASQGIRVAYIKHDVHGFDMDRKDTDTWRIGRAGARQVKISSPGMVASIARVDGEKSLAELSDDINGSVDLIVVEGFKRTQADRIEVSRSGRSDSLACQEGELVAVISDRAGAATTVPVFDIGDVESVAGFLVERYGLRKDSLPKDL